MRVLILGAAGMLGNAVMRILSESDDWEVFGTIRSAAAKQFFIPKIAEHLVTGCDVENHDDLVHVFGQIRPDVVINCVSLAKGLIQAGDRLSIVSIFSLLPHRLARLCSLSGARLLHISTDGVFSGAKGDYTENDLPDPQDLYGTAKLLGEVYDASTITLRTSMIGHELGSANGLLEWFLSQEKQCKCFSSAYFSGLPTVVLAQIIRDVVIPRPNLSGVYHVAAQRISKCDLLQLIAKVYGKAIEIVTDDRIAMDRSLNVGRFQAATGYVAPDWPSLIELMHSRR